MKELGQWNSTTVILVGLNGRPNSDRPQELDALNLHSENTQVLLFIKPAQKKPRDEAIFWKIDQNVSLADVGKTIFDLIGLSQADSEEADLPIHSLINTLKNSEADWSAERPLMIESCWAPWRDAGSLRVAVVANHVLYINDAQPKLYNTLVDRMETNPLPLLQESLLPTTQKINSIWRKQEYGPFALTHPEWMQKLSMSFDRWTRLDQEALLLKDLRRIGKALPADKDIQNWTAHIAINHRDWEALKEVGVRAKQSLWEYVADKNLLATAKNKTPPKVDDPCFNLLLAKELDPTTLKTCEEPLFLDLIDWIRAETRELPKDAQRTKFQRAFRIYVLDQTIAKANIASGLLWDTPMEDLYAPSKTELALSLPEFSKIREKVYKALSGPEEEK
jgi:hypothetical protein